MGKPSPDHLFHFSLRSRDTAMLAGSRTLIQTRYGPDRHVPSTFFDTMPLGAEPASMREAGRAALGEVFVKQDPRLGVAQ
jgi:hypothetical protein